MNIDIHRRNGNRYIAVPAGNTVPESWAGASYFKTIDLEPGDNRIGTGDATTILANIAKEGWSDMGAFRGA